jgi:hypothetical protein
VRRAEDDVTARHQRGLDELSDALEEAATVESVERWCERLSFDAFNSLIREKLNQTYPLPYFNVETYGVMWPSEHAGEDIDPGVKWATLLRLAIAQVQP